MSDSTTIAAYREQFERHGLKLPPVYEFGRRHVVFAGLSIGPDASLALCLTTALAAMDWPVVYPPKPGELWSVRTVSQSANTICYGPDIHAAVLRLLEACEPGELR